MGRILGCLGGGFGEKNETKIGNEVEKYQAPGGLAAGRFWRRKVSHNGQFCETGQGGTFSVPHGHFPPLFPFGYAMVADAT